MGCKSFSHSFGNSGNENSQKPFLLHALERETKKSVNRIDPGYADFLVRELYVLDGAALPQVTDAQLTGVTQVVKARFPREEARALPRRTALFCRWASAVCAAIFLFFFANLIAAQTTGNCLLNRIGITICCDINHNHHHAALVQSVSELAAHGEQSVLSPHSHSEALDAS